MKKKLVEFAIAVDYDSMVLSLQEKKIQSTTHNTLNFRDLEIQHICNFRLKNSYISVDKNANIILKTPRVSQKYIENLLVQKEHWIRKKIHNALINPPLRLNLEHIHSQKSKDFLQLRLEHFAQKMGLKYNELKFRKMKSRWGSCTATKVITLNKKLIKTPSICIDYVLIHELAHLVHMNHSKKFHALVESFIPQANEAKKLLSRVVFDEAT